MKLEDCILSLESMKTDIFTSACAGRRVFLCHKCKL